MGEVRGLRSGWWAKVKGEKGQKLRDLGEKWLGSLVMILKIGV